MRGTGRAATTRRRCLAAAAIVAAAGLCLVVAPSALAKTYTVRTSRGGTCHLQTIASRAGTRVTYGVKVASCHTRFGVRYAVSQGILYDEDNSNLPVTNGYLSSKQGGLPYQNQRSVTGTNPAHTYRTRVDITIVLKSRRSPRTRHPERWTHSGKRCRVKTTRHAGDSLGCELGVKLPP